MHTHADLYGSAAQSTKTEWSSTKVVLFCCFSVRLSFDCCVRVSVSVFAFAQKIEHDLHLDRETIKLLVSWRQSLCKRMKCVCFCLLLCSLADRCIRCQFFICWLHKIAPNFDPFLSLSHSLHVNFGFIFVISIRFAKNVHILCR